MTVEPQAQPAAESTPAPAPPRRPRLPVVPGPVETAVAAWRRLRKMSTALALLFTLAVASIVATFVPQEPLVPATVARWREGTAGPGRGFARVFDALDLFDLFGSRWFLVLVLLLFTSLTGCLVPRWRAFARTLRRPPATGRDLERLTSYVRLETSLAPEAALDAAERVLARRRYRRRRIPGDATRSGAPQIAAERGHAREGGSLVFHTAFYVLLVGIVIGKAYGFTGQIDLPIGGAFADTRIAYDFAEAGRLWGLDDHRGFLVTLDDFDVSWHPDGTPREFRSTVTVTDGGATLVDRASIVVNKPLTVQGMKLFQARFGFAPHIVVRAGDRVLVDEQVLLRPAGQGLWSASAKVAVADEDSQIALDLLFAPDAELDATGNPVVGTSPEPRNPVMVATVYFGDLGLERTAPATAFDRAAGPAGPPAMLRPGAEAELADGALSVEFVELGWWSGFQVSHAPGRWLLLLASVLVLAGLVPSLYGYRRRLWVEARPSAAGTTLVLAGNALQRKAVFADEFAAVEDDLAGAVHASRPRVGDSP